MRDRKTLALLSERTARELRKLRRGQKPKIITDEEWASTDRPKKLKSNGTEYDFDDPGDRRFFDRLIAFYRQNKDEHRRTSRKALTRKLDQVEKRAKKLSLQLNEPDIIDALTNVSPGDTLDDKRTRAEKRLTDIRGTLRSLVKDLERARSELPKAVRKTPKKAELLYHLIYFLHGYLREMTGKGLSRAKSADAEARRLLVVWLFKIADADLKENTIRTAMQKVITKIMQDPDYGASVDKTVPSIFSELWDLP